MDNLTHVMKSSLAMDDQTKLLVGLVCSDAELVKYYVQLITKIRRFILKGIFLTLFDFLTGFQRVFLKLISRIDFSLTSHIYICRVVFGCFLK